MFVTPTRNTSSTKAQDLASGGIEVVCANIDDPSILTLASDGPESGKRPELRNAEVSTCAVIRNGDRPTQVKKKNVVFEGRDGRQLY